MHLYVKLILSLSLSLSLSDVGIIARYAINNGFKLNLAKFKAIILSSRAFVSRRNFSISPRISVGDTALPFVIEVRNIGVVMSSNLSWRSHVLSICKRAHFALHRVKYHRNILSRELRSTLVTSLIFPILDYCCLVCNVFTYELNTNNNSLIVAFVLFLTWDVMFISPRSGDRLDGWLSGLADSTF